MSEKFRPLSDREILAIVQPNIYVGASSAHLYSIACPIVNHTAVVSKHTTRQVLGKSVLSTADNGGVMTPDGRLLVGEFTVKKVRDLAIAKKSQQIDSATFLPIDASRFENFPKGFDIARNIKIQEGLGANDSYRSVEHLYKKNAIVSDVFAVVRAQRLNKRSFQSEVEVKVLHGVAYKQDVHRVFISFFGNDLIRTGMSNSPIFIQRGKKLEILGIITDGPSTAEELHYNLAIGELLHVSGLAGIVYALFNL